MTRIYRFKKPFKHGLGNGSNIVLDTSSGEGDIYYAEQDKDGKWFYYPKKGGYPMWERSDFKFVDEFMELIEETDKPRTYFLNHIYTQEDVDKLIEKIKNEQ